MSSKAMYRVDMYSYYLMGSIAMGMCQGIGSYVSTCLQWLCRMMYSS